MHTCWRGCWLPGLNTESIKMSIIPSSPEPLYLKSQSRALWTWLFLLYIKTTAPLVSSRCQLRNFASLSPKLASFWKVPFSEQDGSLFQILLRDLLIACKRKLSFVCFNHRRLMKEGYQEYTFVLESCLHSWDPVFHLERSLRGLALCVL